MQTADAGADAGTDAGMHLYSISHRYWPSDSQRKIQRLSFYGAVIAICMIVPVLIIPAFQWTEHMKCWNKWQVYLVECAL